MQTEKKWTQRIPLLRSHLRADNEGAKLQLGISRVRLVCEFIYLRYISGMVSYTISSMMSLRKVLKAFAKSSFTKISSSVIFVTKLLEACIAASPPPGTATPTCNGAKKESSLP